MISQKNQRRATLSLLIGYAISSQTAAAQDESAKGVDRLETIQVEGVATDVGEDRLGLEEIQQLNPNDLQDLFRNTPSVQVGSSISASQKVYVHGIEETNLAVTIDGARQNNKLFHHSGTNIIDPELLKAVSVDAGVAPADAGPGALGGSLAYETKDVSDLLEDGDNFGGSVGLEYNTNGDTFDRHISLYGRSGGFEVLGYAKKASGNDFEDGNNDVVVGSESALKTGLIKIGYLHESGYRTKLSYEAVEDDGNRPGRANFNSGVLSENNNLDRKTLVFSVKDETPEGLINPYIKVARSETKLDWIPTGAPYTTFGEYESLNGVIANTFVLGTGTVDAGVDFFDDTSKGIFPGWATFEEEAQNIGVFAQARLTPTERSRVSFGARFDDHEIKGIDGSVHDSDGVSGNISGEYDLTSFVTLSAGYSHVFGGVQLMEPYIGNPSWDYSGGFKESEADNGYVGLNVNGEALNASLSGLTVGVKLFKTDIDDIRDEEYAGGPDVYSDVETDGFELTGRYEWQSGSVRLTYVDIDTEINGIEESTSSYYIGTAIGRSLKVDFVQSIDSVNTTFGADVQHYYSMDGHDGTNTIPGAFPSYTVANSFVEYAPQAIKNLTLRASVNNMFDEDYSDRASYGHEFGSDITLNEPGRSVVLGAKFKF
ncbi:TonB-dependent receptor domain-containing protein [Neptuniibacter sp. QD57_21]|uniref:TonB-dependent receptor domain-containing protein n=1 Tax=Neptuniibacter sp. QD57_21 TaxID=3398213 RepID=UPI0039F4A763